MSQSHSSKNLPLNATGPVRYNMTNDYMFKTVLQRNNHVLVRLLCSLLHLKESDINSAVVTNPIKPGDSITAKTIILDVNINLNDDSVENLEMQVANEKDWVDRSCYYLCRNFAHLKKGEPYTSLKQTYQIAFLDFTLFPKEPEFYATYLFMNRRSHSIYNDKLHLSVICLSEIDRATEEDQYYQIDVWARLFKATTWEELKMLSTQDSVYAEAMTEMYEISEDERHRQLLEAREDQLRRELAARNALDTALAERDTARVELDSTRVERDDALAKLDIARTERDAAVSECDQLHALLASYEAKFGPLSEQ